MLYLSFALFVLIFLAALAPLASAYTIHFQNNCPYTVWAAVGKAPNGQPDTSISFGKQINSKGNADYDVANNQIGIRAWGRTGCDG